MNKQYNAYNDMTRVTIKEKMEKGRKFINDAQLSFNKGDHKAVFRNINKARAELDVASIINGFHQISRKEDS